MTTPTFIPVEDIIKSEMAKLRQVVTQPGIPLEKDKAILLLELGLIEPVDSSRQIYTETRLGREVFIQYLIRHASSDPNYRQI